MRVRSRIFALFVSILAVGALIAACGVDESRVTKVESDLAAVTGQVQQVQSATSQIGKVSEPTTDRHFFVTLVEWKGTTSADQLAPPTQDPKTLSDGYGFKGPGVLNEDKPQDWQVATYVFTPASMIAYQGDNVSLTMFVVNGNEHAVWVESPSGADVVGETEMNRGREYNISFQAEEAGTYILHCDNHDPTMTGYIQVLPR